MSGDKVINILEQLGNGITKQIVKDENGKVMYVAISIGGNDETTNKSTANETDSKS
jgi:hypothetical protein